MTNTVFRGEKKEKERERKELIDRTPSHVIRKRLPLIIKSIRFSLYYKFYIISGVNIIS